MDEILNTIFFRFWETDIRVARKANKSTIRRKHTVRERQEDLAYDVQAKNLGGTLERALREALDDDTFRKVKRMSYSSNAAKGVSSINVFKSVLYSNNDFSY